MEKRLPGRGTECVRLNHMKLLLWKVKNCRISDMSHGSTYLQACYAHSKSLSTMANSKVVNMLLAFMFLIIQIETQVQINKMSNGSGIREVQREWRILQREQVLEQLSVPVSEPVTRIRFHQEETSVRCVPLPLTLLSIHWSCCWCPIKGTGRHLGGICNS